MLKRYNISGEIGIGGATAAALATFLGDNPGEVEIVVNSPGGSATEGAAMMAEVERHGRVTARIRGIAASAATLPALAARKIVMHPSAVIMIHEPSVMTAGTADGLRSDAEALDKLSAIYAAAYARHTGQPVARIFAWMKAETWLTAEEAKELNFCDEIEPINAPAATASAFDYTKYRDAPQDLLRLAQLNGWVSHEPKAKKTETANV